MAKAPKNIATLTHNEAQRLNVPTAEMASLYEQQEEMLDEGPRTMALPRARPLAKGETRPRDTDLDPQIVWNGVKITLTKAQVDQLAHTGTVEIGDAQLVWRGKDTEDWSDLVVNVPPLYIQEKVHPKALIDELKRQSRKARAEKSEAPDLFADFNGLADPEARAEFYQHPMHWQNRFILGDSLQVMASLAEREALKGKVQAIYFDPPYGIKFNSNWQVSTLSRDVKDGKQADISREPEQVKAFRDTWKDGIHSYLTYLRDRLMVARELLTESGSIFVQIGDENVHRVRALMDEVFGAENKVAQIAFRTTTGRGGTGLSEAVNYLIWYGRKVDMLKYRRLTYDKADGGSTDAVYTLARTADGGSRRLSRDEIENREMVDPSLRVFRPDNITSARPSGENDVQEFYHNGKRYSPGRRTFATDLQGLTRLAKADRLWETNAGTIQFVRYLLDYPRIPFTNVWTDTGTGSFTDEKLYVVQTGKKVIERCLLMATDPGDLVLDPTCGSGTTATVAEQWGRRWITIDTSRVALALARTRLMSARYPFYLLADSIEGRDREGKLTGRLPSDSPTHNDIRQGFVYERAPHITLKSIANNSRIDDIYEAWQEVLEPLREALNVEMGWAKAPHPSPLPEGAREQISDGGVEAATSTEFTSPLGGEVGAPAPGEGALAGWQDWQIPRDLDQWLETKDGGAWLGAPLARAAENAPPERSPLPASPTRGEVPSVGKGSIVPDAQKNTVPLVGRVGEGVAPGTAPAKARPMLNDAIRKLHAKWWEGRIARQKEIDDAIAQAADVELLYDRPYEDKSKVRVAGPFTVESLSPHRVVTARDESLGDDISALENNMQRAPRDVPEADFGAMVLENLRAAGVNQKDKADSIRFNSVEPWPGQWLAAEGRYTDGDGRERRAAILIGPEFGTLTRSQITAAAREASESRFDALIACAFNYDAQAGDLNRLGPLPIIKARMNPDLHMADELKTTGKGNLFVVFGEPDIDIIETANGEIQIKVNGIDVFDPSTGEIRSDDIKGIACWFVDTDYNEESFFVRHAYFLGANDPYKALKTSLRAEIDEDAWASLYSDLSRPFPRPETGRIAVKVINHFGDEVLKVYGV